MFEEYLIDARCFFDLAIQAKKEYDVITAKRNFRASIFLTLSALESYVNFIADSFKKGNTLSEIEIAFLNDEIIRIKKGKASETTEFHKIDEKLRLLFDRYNSSFNYNSKIWSDFFVLKKFRDTLIHPRELEDETSLAIYENRSRKGITAIIKIMNTISFKIFKKNLRKKILDLIPLN